MADADPTRRLVDDAWGLLPRSRGNTAGVGSFTRTRVERTISLVVGLGSLVLGTQGLLIAIGTPAVANGQLPLIVVTFASMALMVVLCLLGRGVRFGTAQFAIVYTLMLVAWPFLTPPGSLAGQEPWPWYVLNFSTLAAVVAFPLAAQIVFAAALPLLYGAGMLVVGEVGDGAPLVLDISFSLILGGLLITLGWLFRAIASNVDRARADAVTSFSDAAAASATEDERIAVAALMHDSVLAALIAAERAGTERERTLAVAMAREALTRLANADREQGEGSDAPTDAAAVADAIVHASADLGVTLPLERSFEGAGAEVPGRVAGALILAATQAVANAVEHADAAGLAVEVRSVSEPARIRIEVVDTGEGFDLGEVAEDRLGIRGSIVARVAAVGGTADIASDRRGTRVRIAWEAPAS